MFFQKKFSSVKHTFIRIFLTMLKSWEWFNSRKTHRQMTGYTRGLTSTTAVDWHLKVKDIKYNVGLTNNYCITVSMQKKISSIHKLILKIRQILWSHELNGHSHFWSFPPKNYWNNFYLSWICTCRKKTSSLHLFIHEIQLILDSRD